METKKVEIEIPAGKEVKWVNGVLTLVDEKPQDVTERIKTFEDACRELGSEHPYVRAYDCYLSHIHQHNMDDADLLAYLQIRIITEALNEGWRPKFVKGERRWYFWYDLITKEQYDELSDEDKCRVVGRGGSNANAYRGLVYAHANSVSSSSDSYYGSRLAFKSEELAAYAGRQFAEIYADFCFKPKEEDEKKA
ncbi:hypothetical protein [Bacteroides pyogenes]|uniref:hypothetical protein n=1 Tax=Bacteroides pyogenes TaxID=310300 RepID=UPI00242CB39D|nr:hypothetical protein [Bacteroides pyogenes]